MQLTLTLTITITIILALILTLTRTAACGNYFAVRGISHRYWRKWAHCGWTDRPSKPRRPETNTPFNTLNIHKDGSKSNTVYHRTDHSSRFWCKVSFIF